jgi:[ribosomal protein S5]-alanine N-acetyltransferase
VSVALAEPSALRDGEVTLLLLDANVPALLVAASRDEQITRWTQVPEGMTLLDAGLVTAGWASNRAVVRLTVSLGAEPAVGMVILWVNDAGAAEVGYWLLESARGRGTASAAVRMLCDWAFASCDLDELQLTTLPGNIASERVAIACGFRPAGTVTRDIKGSAKTMRLWMRTRDEDAGRAGQRDEMGA